MSRIILSGKYTGETQTIAFDFISRLAVGETISSQSVTASVFTGVDASPAALISGAATASGTIVSQKLTAGVVGTVYDLACTVTTSLGQTLIISALFPIYATQP